MRKGGEEEEVRPGCSWQGLVESHVWFVKNRA